MINTDSSESGLQQRQRREHRQAPAPILPIGPEISLSAYVGTGQTAVSQLVQQGIKNERRGGYTQSKNMHLISCLENFSFSYSNCFRQIRIVSKVRYV